MEFCKLSNQVIGASIEVHKNLGPGLLESTYSHCLAHELQLREIKFRIQHPMPVKYKGSLLEIGYRVDFLVDGSIIVELKSVDSLNRIHEAQLLTYMKLSDIRTGLLINFNVKLLKNGIRRFVL